MVAVKMAYHSLADFVHQNCFILVSSRVFIFVQYFPHLPEFYMYTHAIFGWSITFLQDFVFTLDTRSIVFGPSTNAGSGNLFSNELPS